MSRLLRLFIALVALSMVGCGHVPTVLLISPDFDFEQQSTIIDASEELFHLCPAARIPVAVAYDKEDANIHRMNCEPDEAQGRVHQKKIAFKEDQTELCAEHPQFRSIVMHELIHLLTKSETHFGHEESIMQETAPIPDHPADFDVEFLCENLKIPGR